jgi:hypothetical protein
MGLRLKAALITLTVAIALPVIAWTGTLLYWHITIKREIASLESEPPASDATGSVPSVISGGCRAIPYLVDVLETSHHEMMLISAIDQISNTAGYSAEINELFRRHPFTPQDPPSLRRANYLKVRAWWIENGGRYHQWWRVWSGRCRR